MPVTNFSITNQHDFLLAVAAIGLNSTSDYTLTLANDVILAGIISLNGIAAGHTLPSKATVIRCSADLPSTWQPWAPAPSSSTPPAPAAAG